MDKSIIIISLIVFIFSCQNSQTTNSENQAGAATEAETKAKDVAGNSNKTYEFQVKKEKAKPAEKENTARTGEIIEGYFVYMADAEIFYPCGAEQGMKIIKNEEYVNLERSYIQLKDLKMAEKVYTKVRGNLIAEADKTGKFSKTLMIRELLEFGREKKCIG